MREQNKAIKMKQQRRKSFLAPSLFLSLSALFLSLLFTSTIIHAHTQLISLLPDSSSDRRSLVSRFVDLCMCVCVCLSASGLPLASASDRDVKVNCSASLPNSLVSSAPPLLHLLSHSPTLVLFRLTRDVCAFSHFCSVPLSFAIV